MSKHVPKSQDLVFGIHPILELLKAKKRSLVTIYTTKPFPKAWDSIAQLLPKSVQVQYTTRDVLERIAGTTDHQGVVAWAQPFPYRSKPFDPAKQPFLVMLDGVQDTRNLGAIIRSAYCTGADGIVLTRKAASPLTAAALKASAGLAEYMQIYQAPSPAAAVQELRSAGYVLYVTALDGKNALEVDYKKPLCIVIGNEAVGVSPQIYKESTRILLPQHRPDISYNASVAAGITLFWVSQKIGRI